MKLSENLQDYMYDPFGFVTDFFPWDEIDGGDGPRGWQREYLIELGNRMRVGRETGEPALMALSSGHSIGKSALVSWLILWSMTTYPNTRGVVTANSEPQLKSKTWSELSKWYHLLSCKELFKFTATRLVSSTETMEDTWRFDMMPWNERRTESFAGLHNQGNRIMVIFDEASGIVDEIWNVVTGALMDDDTDIAWCVFGNPTRNTGRFMECFVDGSRWWSRKIDARGVEGINRRFLDDQVRYYGEDSDYVRVRIRGEFPRQDDVQLIGLEEVELACDREAESHVSDSLIMGVDVARHGTDSSQIVFRRGLDARTDESIALSGMDTMVVAGRVASEIHDRRPDAVFVDEGGVGGGVVDRLRQLGHRVIGIQFGSRADSLVDGVEAANKRAEMWLKMKHWLRRGAIPDCQAVRDELTSVDYYIRDKGDVVLESKRDMRRRGLPSPDWADALALTFAMPVLSKRMDRTPPTEFVDYEYDPLSESRVFEPL